MRSCLLGVFAVLALILRSAVPAPPVPRPAPAPITVVPVLYLEHRSPKKEVSVIFHNASKWPFKYLAGGPNDEVYCFEMSLYKDGKYVKSNRDTHASLLIPENLRTLKPGGRVMHTIDLAEDYWDLQPGRYELRVKYDMAEGARDEGVTPISFEYKVYDITIK